MPEIIFDTCVLSNFALAGSLRVIKSLYQDSAFITDFVSQEILKGIIKGHAGLAPIREALKDGWLSEIVLETEKEKSLFSSLFISLGSGEASSLAVAKSRGFVFACDDKAARKEAELLGVKLTGTLGILIKAVRENIVGVEPADKILKKMISEGFYSPARSIRKIMSYNQFPPGKKKPHTLHEKIRRYAIKAVGTLDDLDPDLEKAAVEHLASTSKRVRRRS